MSFGFSVGDVILLSQLSYQIYRNLTSGRKNASRNIQELSDVLFGFQCALDHLSNVADNIFEHPAPSSQAKPSALDMRSKLDQMVRNCATTLEDLDSATKKYREAGQQDDEEFDSKPSMSRAPQRSNLRRRLASNIMRIRWDIDKDTSRVYRDKLQAHTDAINLVLNTFVWSTTQRIHADSKLHAEKLTGLYDQVAASNQELAQLLHSFIASASAGASSTQQTTFSAHVASSIAPQTISGSSSTTAEPSSSTASSHLPSHILTLNAKRLAHSASTVDQVNNALKIAVPPQPRKSAVETWTVQRLIKELPNILPKDSVRELAAHKAEITAWIQQLDRLLDARIWGGTSKKKNQDLVDILIHLNDGIEHADNEARKRFYEYSRATNIDFVLGKIERATGSVRARQQIEEFVESREEWEEMYQEAGG